MQQSSLRGQKDDSDNDEGFVVNTVEIKHKEALKIPYNSSVRPQDYQPRFINANSFIKKQLSDLINSYPHFRNQEPTTTRKLKKRKDSESFYKVQQSKFPNSHYQIVYQRNGKKNQSEAANPQNEISLASVVSYSTDNYSILKNWQIKSGNDDLIFESRFQCGNLLCAYKNIQNPNHYVLFLQNDTNTKGYNKWFYFAIKNKKSNVNYVFSIVNFRKNFSFIKEGMRLTRFSLKEQQANGIGWSKCGNNIHMYRSKTGYEDQISAQYYTLTFQIEFEYENDTTFLSLLPPYSYSRLINFLMKAKKSCLQRQDVHFQFKTIAHSLTNTQVPYVIISSGQRAKKNIIVLARQHPGQVWSSFFVESLMQQLFRDSFAQKEWLLKNFTFRIFPMINVDGVIYGNFRCDLSGVDMNRSWKQPTKLLHPHLVAIKEQILRLSKQEQILCCFDMHAHSKEHNIFAYCCKADSQGRILPFLISRISNLFYFPSCTFGISKYKESTARAVIYDMTRVPDVLTIQTSFFSSNNPQKTINPASFITISNALVKALKYYFSKGKQYLQAEEQLPKAMAQISSMKLKNKSKYAFSQSGSDSQPECDQIALTQKLGNIIPKCLTVEIALGISKLQKNKLDSIPKLKQISPKKKKNQIKKEEVKLSTIMRNTISDTPHKYNEKKSSLFIKKMNQKNKNLTKIDRQKSMKKQQKRISQTQQIQKNQFDKHSKHQFIYNINNQSLDLNAKKTTLNKFLASQFRSSFRQKDKTKYSIEYKYQKKQQQQFPLLCVLSERKKQAHLQRLRRIHPAPIQRDKPIVRYQPTLFINKKLDTMQKLRERQKNSSQLVSSLWKQTLGYQPDSPITHIFYG